MKQSKFDTSLLEGAHFKLNKMAGEWRGTTKTWLEQNVTADESTTHGNISPILGGRFLLHEYKSSLHGKKMECFVIYGYAITDEKYQSAWVDSFHMGTGIMFSESRHQNGELHITCNFKGGNENWSWRTEIDMPDDNKMVITAYNISPDGKEVKATETIYKRIA